MVTITKTFNNLMKLFLHNNSGHQQLLNIFIPIIGVPTPIAIFDGLQSSQLGPNMDLVPIDLEMEQIHLINELKQFHCIDQKPLIQLFSIPHLEHVEAWAIPIIV
jgi:hypothetical protein